MSEEKQASEPLLGDVLVTGGCGFFGWHLVRQLLDDPDCGAVTVLDRNTAANRHEGATYVTGDITDEAAVRGAVVLSASRPRTIFHTASPNSTFPTPGFAHAADLRATNVRGTELLLRAAREPGSAVRAFVFTSTIDVFADPPHADADETHPQWDPDGTDPAADEYDRSKVAAGRLVQAANGDGGLRTAVLMLSHLYGERDSQALRVVLDTALSMPASWPTFQIGDGANEVEVLSAPNAALAHRLAAKALLEPSRAAPGRRVDGEAFIVSDGRRVLFWHHMRTMWRAAAVARGDVDGSADAPRRTIVIPAWLMWTLVVAVEWALRVFTLGLVAPPKQLSRVSLSYTLYSHTYDTRKARETLGFEPESDHDGVVARAVEWELRRRREEAKQKEAAGAGNKGVKGE